MTPKELISALNWRYATKQFDPEKTIPAEQWNALEEALVLTPSSYGLQPWKFLIVTNSEIREQLVEHSWGQRQVADASHLVVMTVKAKLTAEDVEQYMAHTATVQGVDPAALDSLKGMLLKNVVEGMSDEQALQWAKLQSYIALGNFMTSAAVLGVDACPMEGFSPPDYDRILGLEGRGLTTSVLCPVGYRDDSDKYTSRPKVRFNKVEVVEYVR